MGERQEFQPLTREDTITVLLYRLGIVVSAVIVCALAFFLRPPATGESMRLARDLLGYGLYISVGMSVFFIHLYIGKFKTYLKNLYFISLGALVVLLVIGKGSLSGAFAYERSSLLLLLPLSGCLGFVAAKEAFCFKLVEGYVLAMLMPLYLLLVASSVLSGGSAFSGLILIAVLLAVFTLRKTFMPLAYDIGDKTAYR